MPAGTHHAVGARRLGGRGPHRRQHVLVGDHQHGRDARAAAGLADRAADRVEGDGRDGEVLDGRAVLRDDHARRVDGLAEDAGRHGPRAGAGDHLVEAAGVGGGGQGLAQQL